jgi:transcriptional regulator with XRE-family HTH domain
MIKKEDILFKIGLKIRKLREEKNVSQQDLAAICNFEKSNMSRIEAGKTNLTIWTLIKIAQSLQVKLIDIVDVE